MCVLIYCTTFVSNISHSKKNSVRYHKCTTSSCKVLVIRVRRQLNATFLDRFSINPQIRNFMKICRVRAELLHAGRRTEGQTDTTKLIVAIRNFANSPNDRPVFHFDMS